MKATPKLLATAVFAAVVLVSADVQAQTGRHSGSYSGYRGGGSHWGGHSGGYYRGGHWYGGRGYWYPSWGFYYGLPLFAAAAWGWPYYYDYYYPRSTIIYRDVERYPEYYPEGRMEAPPSTQVPRAEGAPSQGPLYMNYCESAKAYFPKVTSCPEGWRFLSPSS